MSVRRSVFAVTFAAAGLVACGGGSDDADTSAAAQASVAANATGFNDADVAFAQQMIPHHESAIEMADIALDPAIGAGPAVKDLATRIKGAQDPEIKQMTALLTGWGKPVAMEMTDGEMASMDGMVSMESMEALNTLTGTEFDKAWARLMIEHHEGAITMANTVTAAGSNADILTLADAIIAAQQAEIIEMQSLAK
jgi:uncharacterized protein (DUF305 family)